MWNPMEYYFALYVQHLAACSMAAYYAAFHL